MDKGYLSKAQAALDATSESRLEITAKDRMELAELQAAFMRLECGVAIDAKQMKLIVFRPLPCGNDPKIGLI